MTKKKAIKKKVIKKKVIKEPIPNLKRNKGGRPTKFNKSMIKEAEKLAMLGVTIENIADFLNIHRKTFHNYLNKHPEFMHTLKNAKAVADQNVESGLYNRACGIHFEEEHYELQPAKKGKTKRELVLTKKITKFLPPDVGAGCLWLTNRKKGDWQNTQKINFIGEIKHKLSMKNLKNSLGKYKKANEKDASSAT